MFAERESGRDAHGQVVAADVVDGGGLDHFPDVGLLEMCDFVVVGGGEVCAHGAMVVGDDDAAFTCGGVWVDVVFYVEAWWL